MFKTLRYSIMFKTVPLLIILSCGGDQRIETVFNEELENIKSRYTPDRALDVFSIHLKNSNSKWVLSGETTDENAFTRTNEIADSLFGKTNVINNILLLPDAALNDSIFGIINVSVSPLREEPRHSSQMVDQAIMGSTINLLKKRDDWYLVQTDYDYIGWMNKTSISVTDTARKRLAALEEFTDLGSGFKIAMRDLEIRGAGNILGKQQSGFMYSIGFDLYARLLRDAIEKLRNENYREEWEMPQMELRVSSFLDEKYIPSYRDRMDFFRSEFSDFLFSIRFQNF